MNPKICNRISSDSVSHSPKALRDVAPTVYNNLVAHACTLAIDASSVQVKFVCSLSLAFSVCLLLVALLV